MGPWGGQPTATAQGSGSGTAYETPGTLLPALSQPISMGRGIGGVGALGGLWNHSSQFQPGMLSYAPSQPIAVGRGMGGLGAAGSLWNHSSQLQPGLAANHAAGPGWTGLEPQQPGRLPSNLASESNGAR